MPDSIKTTRICLVVAAGLEIATAALLLFIVLSGAVLVGWGTERSELLGSALLGAAGIMLAAVFSPPSAILDLFIASGIAKGRPWSRIAGHRPGRPPAVAVPVGTVLGIIALKGLLGRDARDWFGSLGPGRHPIRLRPLSRPSRICIPSNGRKLREEPVHGQKKDHRDRPR